MEEDTTELAQDAADNLQSAVPEAAEAVSESLQDVSLSLLQDGQEFIFGLTRTWNLYQILIALGIAVLAYGLKLILAPRIPVREGAGVPRWKVAILSSVKSRLGIILFLILIWATVFVMREMTWPSRSYLLGIIGNLALAWLIVGLATRLIRNRPLRRIVSWAAWIWVTLRILNVTDDAVSLLDSLALDLGESRISLWLVLQAVAMLGLFLAIARFLSIQTGERVHRNEDISPSMRVLIVKALQMVLYGGAFFLGLRSVGVDLTGLAILSGAIGVGLGFGLQKVVSNLVSGIIILLDKSIKPGDVISIGETFGWINALGARYVSITTRDGREYLVPNEDLITGQVVNWSHSNDFVRLDIHFGTSYNDDPHKVRKLAVQAAQTAGRVLASKAPVCHITGFGDSSVDYVLRFWIRDPTEGLTNIRGNVYLALWDSFHANDVNIPFPQREVRMLNPTADVSD